MNTRKDIRLSHLIRTLTEALLQKIEAMKRKTADLEKIVNDRITQEKEMEVIIKEKEQLKMLMEKYGVVKSPETC
jgi:hypothetical protein